MSFLAGRLASTEGAYFLQESKTAVTRLAQKKKLPSSSPSVSRNQEEASAPADVLPEILRHSLPSKILRSSPASDSSLSPASRWVIPTDAETSSSASPDVLNPLRAYVSLPQVTMGPKRWQLPGAGNSIQASTANELRRDRDIHINSEKLKAVSVGLSQIAKGFAVATAIVFGGASLTFALLANKLELHNTDDIRTKGKEMVQPRLETVREQLVPVRTWAEEVSKKWQLEKEDNIKNNPVVQELSRVLGAKSPK